MRRDTDEFKGRADQIRRHLKFMERCMGIEPWKQGDQPDPTPEWAAEELYDAAHAAVTAAQGELSAAAREWHTEKLRNGQ